MPTDPEPLPPLMPHRETFRESGEPETPAGQSDLKNAREIAEKYEDRYFCARADNAALLTRATQAEERAAVLEKALTKMLCSATPNQRHHPTMFAAWTDAEAALNPQPKAKP